MKPKPPIHQAQREFFRIELERLVDEGDPLVNRQGQLRQDSARVMERLCCIIQGEAQDG